MAPDGRFVPFGAISRISRHLSGAPGSRPVRNLGPMTPGAHFDGESVVVTGHQAARTVLRDWQTFTVDDPRFTTSRLTGPSMLSTDGREHARHRAPFVGAFSPRRVDDRYAEQVQQLCAELVAAIRPRGRADLRQELAAPLAAAVMQRALGLGEVDRSMLLQWYDALSAEVELLTADGAPTDTGRCAYAAVAERVAARLPGSVLAAAGDSLDPAEVSANAVVMMLGGIDTTEGMISFALTHLLASDWAPRAAADPAVLERAVEESLRLEPAARFVDRYATADTGIGALAVPEGTLVRVDLRAANRDPAVFTDPDHFRPDRPELRRHLSFVVGPHVCIGAHLARLETVAAVRAALTGLPELALADGAAAVEGHVFVKPAHVHARWTP